MSRSSLPKRSTKREEDSRLSSAKKSRLMSSSLVLSDSGCSSMSPSASGNDSFNNCKKNRMYPTIALLNKPEIIMNGRSRIRFPDPLHDRSILLACYDSDENKNMLKIRHGKRNCIADPIGSILKTRVDMERVSDEFYVSDDSCSFVLCLDSIQVHDSEGVKLEVGENIMLADIRDHSVAGQCLPDGVTGFWVRIFGPRRKYSLVFSVWKNVEHSFGEVVVNNADDQKQCKHANKVVKIGEKSVIIWNSGQVAKMKKRKNTKKKAMGICRTLKKHELHGSDHLPSFCSREKYHQILTSLRGSIENAKYDIFEEMYEKFSCDLKDDSNRDSFELKLFLWCERSQFFAIQGNYPEAKKYLQKVVDNVVPKSPNKLFMLNRAYLLLANTHVMEGNNGTAEECLNVIQPDKKNGMPHEDICLYNLLRGIILMNFGKQLPKMSRILWAESKESFKASESNFTKSQPIMFNQHCRMHLNLGRLLIYESSNNSNCSSNTRSSSNSSDSSNSSSHSFQINFEAPEKRICILEAYGKDKLSLHIQCLLQIVRSELLYHLKEIDKGSLMLTEAQQMAEKYRFREECILCDEIRESWNELQYQEFIGSLECGNFSVAVKKCVTKTDLYSADESSA